MMELVMGQILHQGHLVVIKQQIKKTLDAFATLTPKMTSGYQTNNVTNHFVIAKIVFQ